MDEEFAKQKHKPMTLVVALTLAVVFGLGLVNLSSLTKMNFPYTITGNVIREAGTVGAAPTTIEALETCRILYDDHYDYCTASFDEANTQKAQCYTDAKEDCFTCVLTTKNPKDVHLKEYCYK